MSQTVTTKKEKELGIDNYDDFQKALMSIHAQTSGETHIEVTPKLFAALSQGRATNYLTYGSPGVKVYLHGTRGDIEAEERMGLDEFRTLEIKRKRGEAK